MYYTINAQHVACGEPWLRVQFSWRLLLSHFSRVWLYDPIDGSPPGSPVPGILQAKTLECCHFLLQCMKVKSESEVAQSCPTLRDPMDCSPPGSSFHGIFQARVLEWGAIAFSEYSFWGSSKSCISFLFQTSPLYRGKVLLVLILPSVCALCN